MKITILSVGTRGDVQPYIALGLGLRAAGNDVRIAAASNFEQFILRYGLEYARLEGNFREIMETDTIQKFMAKGNPLRAYHELTEIIRHILECFAADSWKACQGVDAVIFSGLGVTGYHIAEKLGIPSCWAPLQPMSRTHSFPSALVPIGNNRTGTLNWFTHIIEEQMSWQPARSFINRWRKDFLGLKPIPFIGPNALLEKRHYPLIYGYSPTVLPRPSDWGDWIHVSGYWFLDCLADWQPPADLVDFITTGKPPVYIGFGSMNNREAGEMTQIVMDAVNLTKQRAVLATGWGSFVDVSLPDTIYKVDAIPHDWLFPQMAAAVHHGGAGTTAAALRAGIPNITVPHIMDQPFWGQRVFDLGVGPKPLRRKQITAECLANAITMTINNKDMKRRATVLAEQISTEDGTAKAVELITRYLSTQ
jgi:UDP:flavonoid glycosyltransferase YjiC (YdhE family)